MWPGELEETRACISPPLLLSTPTTDHLESSSQPCPRDDVLTSLQPPEDGQQLSEISSYPRLAQPLSQNTSGRILPGRELQR